MSVHVTASIWDAPFPTAAMKLVALRLADHANKDGASIFPKVEDVEEATGLSTSAIREAMSDMRASGLLIVMEPGGCKGRLHAPSTRAFVLDRLRGLLNGDLRWERVAVPVQDLKTGATKVDATGETRTRLAWRLVEQTTHVDDFRPPAGGPQPSSQRTPALQMADPSPPTGGPPDREPSLKPSKKEPPTPIADGARGEEQTGKSEKEGTWPTEIEETLGALVRAGIERPVLDLLIGPVLTQRRFSSADRLETLMRLGKRASGLEPEALDRAARDVISPGVRTIKAARLSQAIDDAIRHGARIVIRPGTAQWERWIEHLEQVDPSMAALARKIGTYQARTEWPPQTSDRAGRPQIPQCSESTRAAECSETQP